MKKSTRILAILMAFAMLIGSFSVMGSAYEAYKGSALYNPSKGINSYNDIDVPVFTTEQHASMALDEVDRMLAKEQIYLNIYIGELDLASLNTTITSVGSLLTKVSSLLPLLGDAASLDISAIRGNQRSTAKTTGNVTDVEFITDLLDFIGDIAPIAEKYVTGKVSLGIMNGFISDFIFDVRELAIGLVFGMTNKGEEMDFDAMEDGDKIPEEYLNETNGAITLLQTVLNELVLGEWVQLDKYFADPTLKANVYYNMYSFADDYDDAETFDVDKYDYYGWVHPDDWVLVGLGGCERVTAGAAVPPAEYTAVDITGGLTGYAFIEALLQRAYNYLLVPTLNNQTRHALRQWCGVEYKDEYTKRTVYNDTTGLWESNKQYKPDYAGEPFVESELPENNYNKVFNVNAYMNKVDIPAGETLVDNFNDILGDFLGAKPTPAGETRTGLIKDPASAYAENPDDNFKDGEGVDWVWRYGSNSYLFKNIAGVAKYVIQKTGNALFADYIEVPSASALEAYTDQQVVAFVLRAILNASVDWMYIPEEGNQTILDVGYTAVEQLAYQDIPQYTYTKPQQSDFNTTQEYYDALIEKALDILLDVAVYNLNQSFDAVEASGANPVAGEGLIPYQGDDGDWKETATVVASWAVNEYGPLLAIFDGLNSNKENNSAANLTMDMVWADIDTIVDSLIPIKPDNSPWIATEISDSGLIAKAFIFDYILKPVYTLDATNFATIFKRNTSGSFATMNGVEIIVKILENVFDLLFPEVFSNTAKTVDAILDNELLGTMVYDLLNSLGTQTFEAKTNLNSDGGKLLIQGRGNSIVKVALPIVNMILGLSDEQKFEEIEIYLPEVIATGEDCTFSVYNGSSGINTGYTDKDGNFSQDELYTYTVSKYVAKRHTASGETKQFTVTGLNDNGTQTKFAGGDSVEVKIDKSNLVAGDIIEFNIEYTAVGETGSNIGAGTEAGDTLVKTVYAYVGNVDKDDDAIEIEKPISDGRIIKYESEIYLSSGDDLTDIESYGIRIEDNKTQESWQNTEDTNGDGKVDSSDNQIAPTINVGAFGTVTNTTSTDYKFVANNTEASSTANFSGQGGTYFLNPFKVAEGFERFEENYVRDENGDVVVDEDGNPIVDEDNPNNGGVVNGDYAVTVPVTVADKNGNSPATVETLTITIHLYDDYGLPGAFSSAVAKNRQQSQYSSEGEGPDKWADYVDALKNAAKLALTPKVGSEFQEFIDIDDGTTTYENLYEQYAEELQAAIEALEEFALPTGVEGIRDVIENHDGYNFTTGTVEAVVNGETRTFTYKIPLEYYEDGYKFFGERDYVPHLYDRYRDARSEGQALIDSQEFYVMAPFTCVEVYGEDYEPSDEEITAYNDSILAAAEAMDNARIIGSVEAAYAEHMLNLTSSRLIKLTADKSKLNKALTEICVGVNAGGASFYTEESWTNYSNALEFANEVNAKPVADATGDPTLSPTEVNIAMSELINAWKKLVESCNFTALDAELAASAQYAKLGESTDGKQDTYTEDSYAKFWAAYNEAKDIDRSMGKTDANQDKIDAVTAALTAARTGLVEASAAEPEWGWIEADPDGWFVAGNGDFTIPTTTLEAGIDTDVTVWTAQTEDGTDVDDYIIGVGEYMDDMIINLIIPEDSLKNCYLDITPGLHPFDGSDAGQYGTGTTIQIKATADDRVLKTYQIVLYGDVNCDGLIDPMDIDFIKVACAMLWDYFDPMYGSTAAAGDIDGDQDFTVGDADTLEYVVTYELMVIDQSAGTVYDF